MLSAVGFLTVLGGARTPGHRTLRWFPPVGAAIGGVLALAWLGATALWSPLVAAVVVVALDLVLTGMLHVDGLADTADGVLPHLDRARRLDVMQGPDVGAFALAVVPVVLLARWASLAADQVPALALVAVWTASRTFMAAVPALVPYARAQGLASPFLDGARTWIAAWLVPATVVAVLAAGALGGAAIAVMVVTAVLVVGCCRRRLGGFTGDVLGATAVLAETTALLTLAVDR